MLDIQSAEGRLKLLNRHGEETVVSTISVSTFVLTPGVSQGDGSGARIVADYGVSVLRRAQIGNATVEVVGVSSRGDHLPVGHGTRQELV